MKYLVKGSYLMRRKISSKRKRKLQKRGEFVWWDKEEKSWMWDFEKTYQYYSGE